MRVGRDAYTAAVVDELERRTGRLVAPAAVYIALQRLERRGLMRSEVRVDDGSGDRRERRYFAATPEAYELLHESQRELRSLWKGLQIPGSS